MLFRVPVTLKAPPHRVRLGLVHYLHLIDLSMTGFTGDSSIHVRGMVEEDIVRALVDAHPLDGLTIIMLVVLIKSPPQWLELVAVCPDVLMAVPAGARRGHVRVS